MGKMMIQDVVAILTERNGMDRESAVNFATAMFSLIQEWLEKEHIVKVKGLGTFKIINVEARESVSVNTGERMVIRGHSKVTFTPDPTMRELVNKPFSQFETVVLNDGVEFEDMDEEEPEEREEVQSSEPELQNLESEPQNFEPEPQNFEPEPQNLEPEPQNLEPEPQNFESEPQNLKEELQIPEEEHPVFLTDEQSDEEEPGHPWGRWLLTGVMTLVLMALSAIGGYYFGSRPQMLADNHGTDTVYVKDTVYMSDLADAGNPETIEVEDGQETVADSESATTTDTENPSTTAADVPAEKPAETNVDVYSQKDVRVRLGAYRIVGLDREVKVLAGQTFKGICRANLGPDMECYVEVYNDLPQNPLLKEGQIIKIPKLQLKKRKK